MLMWPIKNRYKHHISRSCADFCHSYSSLLLGTNWGQALWEVIIHPPILCIWCGSSGSLLPRHRSEWYLTISIFGKGCIKTREDSVSQESLKAIRINDFVVMSGWFWISEDASQAWPLRFGRRGGRRLDVRAARAAARGERARAGTHAGVGARLLPPEDDAALGSRRHEAQQARHSSSRRLLHCASARHTHRRASACAGAASTQPRKQHERNCLSIM